MKQIAVDRIIQTPDFNYGYAETNYRVFELLKHIYTRKHLGKLLLSALRKDTSGGLNGVGRCHQYIILYHISLNNEFQGQLYLIDAEEIQGYSLNDLAFLNMFVWNDDERAKFDLLITRINTDGYAKRAKLVIGKY